MLRLQPGLRPARATASGQLQSRSLPIGHSRSHLRVLASWNPFTKGGGGSEEAARRALENLGKGKGKPAPASDSAFKKTPPPPSKAPTPPGDNAPKNPFANMFSKSGAPPPPPGGGGGGSGGGGFGQPGGDVPQGPEQPLLQEFLALMKGMWVMLTNLALFLLFADFLHRSLYWFVQNELLVAVGAPQQAFERFIGKFFEAIEWIEVYVLGWSVPGWDADEDLMRVYEVLQYYTPDEAAYTFAQMKYDNLTVAEKKVLHRAYALRSWERPPGTAPADELEVRAIWAKLLPSDAVRRAYRDARSAGKLEEFWAARGGVPEWAAGQLASKTA